MDVYELGALAIVLAAPFLLVLVVLLAVAWARDALGRAPAIGGIGVLCTLVATGYLFVERTCAATRSRPILMAILGPDECRQSSLVAIEIVLLLAVVTALAVRLGDLRR